MIHFRATRNSAPFHSPRLQTQAGVSCLIFFAPFSYFLFIFSLPRCTLPDFPSVISSLASLPFLPCCHDNNNKLVTQQTCYEEHSELIHSTFYSTGFSFCCFLPCFFAIFTSLTSQQQQTWQHNKRVMKSAVNS